MVTLDSVAAAPGGRTTLVLDRRARTRSFDRSTAVVLGNVARATHGETVTQVLGSGEARRPFQSFALTQGPLTFVPADTATGAASTLRGAGRRRALVGAAHHLRRPVRATGCSSPATSRTAAGRVVFGDGARGARPATGSNNVRATVPQGHGRRRERPARTP